MITWKVVTPALLKLTFLTSKYIEAQFARYFISSACKDIPWDNHLYDYEFLISSVSKIKWKGSGPLKGYLKVKFYLLEIWFFFFHCEIAHISGVFLCITSSSTLIYSTAWHSSVVCMSANSKDWKENRRQKMLHWSPVTL